MRTFFHRVRKNLFPRWKLMFLDSLKRGRCLFSRAPKNIKIEWLTRKLWYQTCSKRKSLTSDFIILGFTQVPHFEYFIREFNAKSMKVNASLWKIYENINYVIEVKLFLLLHVWYHNFLVNHSILIFLDTQKSRDRVLSNGSKNINFHRRKPFFRPRWKKVAI